MPAAAAGAAAAAVKLQDAQGPPHCRLLAGAGAHSPWTDLARFGAGERCEQSGWGACGRWTARGRCPELAGATLGRAAARIMGGRCMGGMGGIGRCSLSV